ncbi:hypothetical protein [Cylindrospermopsis curvispora]|nr:hypothetical protein [Cylindrospermopsis curvispora]
MTVSEPVDNYPWRSLLIFTSFGVQFLKTIGSYVDNQLVIID